MSCPTSVHLVHHTSLTTVHHANTMRAMLKEAEYTTAARTDREFLDYFKEEVIGVECVPKCGGCKCGKCPSGTKEKSIKDEEEYQKFQSLMHLDKVGTEDDPGPYWVSSLPWNIDKETLVDNKAAVLGVMNSTKRKLDKDPTWKEVYETQLRDLIKKGFAREVLDEEIVNWKKNGGKVYYISHQVALNPASKSTPVRVVFNSSIKDLSAFLAIYGHINRNISAIYGPRNRHILAIYGPRNCHYGSISLFCFYFIISLTYGHMVYKLCTQNS